MIPKNKLCSLLFKPVGIECFLLALPYRGQPLNSLGLLPETQRGLPGKYRWVLSVKRNSQLFSKNEIHLNVGCQQSRGLPQSWLPEGRELFVLGSCQVIEIGVCACVHVLRDSAADGKEAKGVGLQCVEEVVVGTQWDWVCFSGRHVDLGWQLPASQKGIQVNVCSCQWR